MTAPFKMPFCRHQGLMESHWMMYSFQLILPSYWFFKGIVHGKLYRLVHKLIKVQCHNTLDSKFCNQFLIASRQRSENHPPWHRYNIWGREGIKNVNTPSLFSSSVAALEYISGILINPQILLSWERSRFVSTSVCASFPFNLAILNIS